MSITIKEQINIAIKAHQAGQFEEAERLYAEVLSLSPNNYNVLNLLGLLQSQLNKPQDALTLIKRANELNPSAYFLENIGRVHFQMLNFEEAISSYKQALELEPENFDVTFNLALAYRKNGQIEEAISSYKRALDINPESADVYFNMANAYEEKDDMPSVIKYYKRAVELNPEDIESNYFLAAAYLKTKDFENGWLYFEKRPSKILSLFTQKFIYPAQTESKPEWKGENIKDKVLHVNYEGGFGDTIMFARYLPLLEPLCKKVLFTPQIDLLSLFEENFSNIGLLDRKKKEDEVVFDTYASIMSLPYLLGLNSESELMPQPFLSANPQKVLYYREKYFSDDSNKNKFKIGIKWQGNTAVDKKRVISIESFSKLFAIPGTKFYSVQKVDEKLGTEKLPDGFEIIDLGETFNDFSDTAAAIENLDLVICNDTSVAHLAGAMGKECWILLPYAQNWRWHDDLSYSPWYESVKLFKQSEPDNWDDVLESVYEELKKNL